MYYQIPTPPAIHLPAFNKGPCNSPRLLYAHYITDYKVRHNGPALNARKRKRSCKKPSPQGGALKTRNFIMSYRVTFEVTIQELSGRKHSKLQARLATDTRCRPNTLFGGIVAKKKRKEKFSLPVGLMFCHQAQIHFLRLPGCTSCPDRTIVLEPWGWVVGGVESKQSFYFDLFSIHTESCIQVTDKRDRLCNCQSSFFF